MLHFDLPHHLALVDWLLAQPPAGLKKHRDYSKFRRERMSQKSPILTGNIQTLGVLPLALAVFLQIHQLTTGHPIGPWEMAAASSWQLPI